MPYIYVIGMDGKPQMPTKRRRHVQKLLDTGKARITERVPFTIQLLYDNDPGRYEDAEAAPVCS